MNKLNKPRKVSSPVLKRVQARQDPVEYEKVVHKLKLAARIGDAMKQQGTSKKELADKLNKQPSVITKWLSGTHNFETDTLIEISTILKIELLNDHRVEPTKQFSYKDVLVKLKPANSQVIIPKTAGYDYKFTSFAHQF